MSVSYPVEIFDMKSGREHLKSKVLTLDFESKLIFLKDIIKARIQNEIMKNQGDAQYQHYLVEISDKEKALNGSLTSNRKIVPDLDACYKIAITGFYKNSFFIMINDKQVDDLDMVVDIEENPKVEFFKLVPLKGG